MEPCQLNEFPNFFQYKRLCRVRICHARLQLTMTRYVTSPSLTRSPQPSDSNNNLWWGKALTGNTKIHSTFAGSRRTLSENSTSALSESDAVKQVSFRRNKKPRGVVETVGETPVDVPLSILSRYLIPVKLQKLPVITAAHIARCIECKMNSEFNIIVEHARNTINIFNVLVDYSVDWTWLPCQQMAIRNRNQVTKISAYLIAKIVSIS